MDVILYNPKSNNNKCHLSVSKLIRIKEESQIRYKTIDITQIDICSFFDDEPVTSKIIIIGGDGTIHFLVNDLVRYELKHQIYLYRGGTGNDFSRSIHQNEDEVNITKFLKNLPIVLVNGKTESFINGCGIGLDGYVCNLVNESKKKNQNGSFYKNTMKGFFKFKPNPASIFIDDIEYKFKKVYLASIMNGTHYGAGMKIAPLARRDDQELDVCVVHKIPRLLLILIFPLIYSGKHLLFKRYVFYKKGKNVRIVFSKENIGQLDGEVIPNIKEIKVYYE